MKSGYFTLAIGNPNYAVLANRLAYSLLDIGIQNISILTDAPCKRRLNLDLFENVIDFTDEYILEKPYWGLAKILMHRQLPYERSVFVDADSLAGTKFKGCDDFNFAFTTSYRHDSWGHWSKCQWRLPKLDIDLPFQTPTHQATSIMWYGGDCEIHEKALYFHEILRSQKGWRHEWFNSIPDEACYTLAYASMEMPNIGDRGFNKTLNTARTITSDREEGIKTYSCGDFRLGMMAQRDYNAHVKRLSIKYGFEFKNWQDKLEWKRLRNS